jgi:hypothetical protein
MPILFILPFILFLITLSIGLYFFIKNNNKKKYLLPDFTDLIPKNASYEFCKVSDLRNDFQNITRNQNVEIQSLYLVHGTFVGDDPWHLISLIEESFPGVSAPLVGQIKSQTKKGQNYFAKDLGNFTTAHDDEFKRLTNSILSINHFTWSSGNGHYARLQGCLQLIEGLLQNSNERILLVGHSHAGQVFALLTQLLNNPTFRKKIISILKAYDLCPVELNSKLKDLKSKRYDFVTLGAPARYNWNTRVSSMTLTHIINHRGRDVLGGSFSGAIFTERGDYIQQWGVAGSDFKSPIDFEQDINLELDELLGEGANIRVLQENIKFRKRLHNEGHHYLVDYNDSSRLPNFFKTIFGHGTYTKVENMDILLNIINKQLSTK